MELVYIFVKIHEFGIFISCLFTYIIFAGHLAMRKMEERIRILEEDLESEQHLRRRVEQEKQELQMQIISLSERVTEAEGGTENQLVSCFC